MLFLQFELLFRYQLVKKFGRLTQLELETHKFKDKRKFKTIYQMKSQDYKFRLRLSPSKNSLFLKS